MLEKNIIPLLNQPQTLSEPSWDSAVGKISAQNEGEPFPCSLQALGVCA